MSVPDNFDSSALDAVVSAAIDAAEEYLIRTGRDCDIFISYTSPHYSDQDSPGQIELLRRDGEYSLHVARGSIPSVNRDWIFIAEGATPGGTPRGFFAAYSPSGRASARSRGDATSI